MTNSIRVRTERSSATITVRLLITHAMLTEQQESPAGHFITDLEVEYAGSILLRTDWGPGISRNPFLMFRFSPERFDGELHIRWVDNRGDRDELIVPI